MLNFQEHRGLNIGPSAISVISKDFEAIMSKKVVKHLTRDNLLSDKQYRLQSAQYSTGTLSLLTESVKPQTINTSQR